jgi:hypothetical protein
LGASPTRQPLQPEAIGAVMKVTKWLNSYVLPNATAPHLAKTGKAQCEHMFSASPLRADIAQCRRHVRFVPKSELCVDGDVGLTARSEAALEPPRFISRLLAGRRTSVRRQAWSWYRACTYRACTRWRCAPGSHPWMFPAALKLFFRLYPESCRFLIYISRSLLLIPPHAGAGDW